jgi:hypothetical protein
MRHHLLLVPLAILAATASLGACGGKPTAEDCKKFADRYVVLMTQGDSNPEATKTVADGMKPKIIAECETSTRAAIICSHTAQTMEEIEACEAANP